MHEGCRDSSAAQNSTPRTRKLREIEPWITMNRDGRQDEGAEGLWASEMRKIANQQENLKRDESAPSH
ncbi:hypothetical protein TWF102_005881 [Orbilia oligospora]|uniref:Uncharacterized protein n=1 Tax=Orbilia oligospora TaxID=2813651 RepID=A0A7C8JJ65_ORBOL|nr:hypothetical protein TWF102_005881 [Orbilia oligospora]